MAPAISGGAHHNPRPFCSRQYDETSFSTIVLVATMGKVRKWKEAASERYGVPLARGVRPSHRSSGRIA